MSKINLLNVESLTNEQTALDTINQNNSTLESSFDNTLSRDGTSPNSMNAQIDMNSNKIINLAAPLNPNDAARLIDVTTGAGTITIPTATTSSTGAVKPDGTTITITADGTISAVDVDSGGGGGGGGVSSVSVTSANGLAGTVTNASTTPAISLSTTINGILSGNGTAISAAATTGSGNVVLATSPTISGLTLSGSLAGIVTGTGNVVLATSPTIASPTFSGTVAGAATIPGSILQNNAVSYAQFQQVAASSLVGNATGLLANATGITLGSTLAYSGAALQTAAITGDVTASANSFATTVVKIQGNAVKLATPSDGQVLTWVNANTRWEPVAAPGGSVPNGGTTGQVLAKNSNANGDTVWNTITGTGTVTSAAITVPGALLSVSGTPITTSGTFAVTLPTQSANLVFAGPTTGSAATPTFRALVAADLPNPTASTLGGIESIVAASHKWINAISTSGVPSQTQPAAADLSDGLTGTGVVVMATTPTLVTPVLGVATATSINKVAFTAPATSATLTIANGKTLTASNTLTLAGTDATVMTFPTTTDTVAGLAATQTLTNKTINGANNTLTVRLGSDVSGNLATTHLNSGTSATSSTYWRGDGTWATPAGSGTTNSGAAGQLTAYSSSVGLSPMSNMYYANYYAGIDPTGVSDSSTGINNLILALSATGGTIIFDGLYKILSAIVLGNGSSSHASTGNGIELVGVGVPGSPLTSNWRGGAAFQAGGTLTDMIKINGPLQGFGIKNISLNANSNIVSYGIHCVAGSHGYIDNVSITGCFYGIYFDTYAAGYTGVEGAGFDCSYSISGRRVTIVVPSNLGNGASGIYFTGNLNHGSDTTGVDFDNVYIYLPNANDSGVTKLYGVNFRECDTCSISNLGVLMAAGGTKQGNAGILFDYTGSSILPAGCSIRNSYVSEVFTSTTTSGTVSSAATSIQLASVTNFPTALVQGLAGCIQIDSEYITYTGISTNLLTGCVRGNYGTAAASHASGATVYLTGTNRTMVVSGSEPGLLTTHNYIDRPVLINVDFWPTNLTNTKVYSP